MILTNVIISPDKLSPFPAGKVWKDVVLANF